jgi:mono/diheme cytochrome c family protein
MNRKLKLLVVLAPFIMAISPLPAADVKENWDKNCASCHGKDGKGETKAGKKAEVKDLTDATYQASFTDEQMFKQIKEGLKDKNGKEKMKPFADKLTDAEVKALIAQVRSYKK